MVTRRYKWVCKLRDFSVSPLRKCFCQKCAIDGHLSTEGRPPLAKRGAKVGGLKCLSMAHF